MLPESGYYPPGAENDPHAPWNEPSEPDEVSVNVEIAISLSNVVTIKTSDYTPIKEEDYDVDYDDDGTKVITGGVYESQDFSETNFIEAYKNDDCNILSLLKEYSEILTKQLKEDTNILNKYKSLIKNNTPAKVKVLNRQIKIYKNRVDTLKRKVAACSNYVIDDIEVFEYVK